MRQSDARDLAPAADIGIMMILLAQVTGDPRWTSERYVDAAVQLRQRELSPDPYVAPPELREEVVSAFQSLLQGWPADVPVPSDDLLLTLLTMATGRERDMVDIPRLKSELGIGQEATSDVLPEGRDGLRVAIVGAGMSGLNLAAELLDAGFDRVVVFERQASSGGVWRQTSYPGAGLDTPPKSYEWRRYPNSWRNFAVRREEILEYVDSFVDGYALDGIIRYNTAVDTLTYRGGQWQVELRDLTTGQASSELFDVVLTAVGTLNEPKYPDIEGLSGFQGRLIHTACWPDDLDLTGQRVGLIGNGSSGVQVGPWLAEIAAQLTVFQRSPAWIAPRAEFQSGAVPDSLRRLLDASPEYAKWYRVIVQYSSEERRYPAVEIDRTWEDGGRSVSRLNAEYREELIGYLKSQVPGRPDLMRKLLPRYPALAKRLVVDNGYLAMMTRANVELITDPIVRAEQDAIVTGAGDRHELDALVVATGFTNNDAFLSPMTIIGPAGKTMLESFENDYVRAYLGVAVPGFPNLFTIYGPNSAAGLGGGATLVGEWQSRYIRQILVKMATEAISEIEITTEANDRYNTELDSRLDNTVWTWENIGTRFQNSSGRVVANQGWSLSEFYNMLSRPDWSDFRYVAQTSIDGTAPGQAGGDVGAEPAVCAELIKTGARDR